MRAKTRQLTEKIRAYIFWDTYGISFIYYFEKRKKQLAMHFAISLYRGKDEIKIKRLQMEKKSVLCQQNYAPCHKSSFTMAKFYEVRITSKSTIFSWSGFQRLLPVRRPQKIILRKRFSSNDEIIAETSGYFEGKDKSVFKKVIEMLENPGMNVTLLKEIVLIFN